jgi:hypothetical protein
MKKEPKLQSKLKTKYLPDQLEKMLARAQGHSLAESDHADELVPEFDLVKNYPLTPWHVTSGSGIAVYWDAICSHTFINTVAARTAALKKGFRTRGCKVCSKYVHEPSMPIRKHYPHLARQWMEKSNSFLTRFLDCRSMRAGLFQCPKDSLHIFRSKVRYLTVFEQAQGCPFCYESRRVDLRRYPRALLLYDRSGRNRGFDLRRLPECYRVFWRCDAGHRWYATFDKVMECGCTKCLPIEAEKLTLADVPDLKSQYWASLNSGRSADSILLKGNSGLVLSWRCTKEDIEVHQFSARLYDRLKGSGCPVCAGKRGSALSSLASPRFKNVADEIDRAHHPSLELGAVSPRSTKKLSFICRSCGKKWQARIDKRCLGGQGCSSCKASSRANKNSHC